MVSQRTLQRRDSEDTFRTETINTHTHRDANKNIEGDDDEAAERDGQGNPGSINYKKLKNQM